MKQTITTQLETQIRQLATINYNAVIYEVFPDSVNAKMPPGSKRIKRDVRLAEHIQRVKDLLKPGMPCQIELRQGKPYVIAIFDLGQSELARTKLTDDDDDSSGGGDYSQTPRPTAQIDCDKEAWVISWPTMEGATSYEVYWTADKDSDPEDAAPPVKVTPETEVEITFDTGDPPKQYFSVRAKYPDGVSPYSPWVTDSFVLTKPAGFTACPVNNGYRLNVKLNQDTSHLSAGFSHWEVQWADDNQGLNAETVIEALLPDDLPKFLSNQADGQWTFDTSADESWGKVHAASPSDWLNEGHTAPGSRIVLNGGNLDFSLDLPADQQWYSGRIIQEMQQFTGRATDSLTAWLNFKRSSGSDSFTAQVMLGAGVWSTTPVTTTDGNTINEYQETIYEQPPYSWTSVPTVGNEWVQVTLTLPPEAVGNPIGFITIKAQTQGTPLTYILADDIVWGPGGLTQAKQKWFRIRAHSCAGLTSDWTDWVSGKADLVIFEKPDNYGCVSPIDARIRYRVQTGKILETKDGTSYTDLTTNVPPTGEGTTAAEIDWIQVLPDPDQKYFYFLGRAQIGGYWNGYLLKLDATTTTWSYVSMTGGALASTITTTIGDVPLTIIPWNTSDGWEGVVIGDTPAAIYHPTSINDEPLDPGNPHYPDPAALEYGWWSMPNPLANIISFGLQSTYKMTFQMGITAYHDIYWYFQSPTWPGACGFSAQIFVSPDKLNWTFLGDLLCGEPGLFHDQRGTGQINGIYTDQYVRFNVYGSKSGSCVDRPTKLYGVGFTDYSAPRTAIYPIWMDVKSGKLGLTAFLEGKIIYKEFDTLPATPLELIEAQTDLMACTLAEVQTNVYTCYPRFSGSTWLVYGRMKNETDQIVQVQAKGQTTLIPLMDETTWLPGDYCGGLLAVLADQATALRHNSFQVSIVSVTDKVVSYQVDPAGNSELDLTVGQSVLNYTRQTTGEIEALDPVNHTFTLKVAPTDWQTGDLLSAPTGSELWNISTANLTLVPESGVLIESIPLTILPGGIAANRSQTLVLGNQYLEAVRLEKSDLPFSAVTDVTALYTVANGIVALAWAESGCAAATSTGGGSIPVYDDDGNQTGVISPPSSGEGGSGSGTLVLVAPKAGTTDNATWRELKHHETTELDHDDHPQYLTKPRGDSRYSPLGHTHTDVGDMLKSVYDTDGDGVVDNAEKLGAVLADYFPRGDNTGRSIQTTTLDGLASGFYSFNGATYTGIAPTNAWYHVLVSSAFTAANKYVVQIAMGLNHDALYTRRQANGGTWTSWSKIWTAYNDGTGSGLDAHQLDGQEGSYYQNASNLNAGTIPLAQIPATLTGKSADTVDGVEAARIVYGDNSNKTTAATSLPTMPSGFYDISGSEYTGIAPTNSWYHIISNCHRSGTYSAQLAFEFWTKYNAYYRIISNTGSQGWEAIKDVHKIATAYLSSDGWITFSGIPTNFRHLMIMGQARSTRTNMGYDGMAMRFNGDAGSNYWGAWTTNINGTLSGGVNTAASYFSVALLDTATNPWQYVSPVGIFIPRYTDGYYKTATTMMTSVAYNTAFPAMQMRGGGWKSTAAISTLQFFTESGTSNNLVAGSELTLYGIRA